MKNTINPNRKEISDLISLNIKYAKVQTRQEGANTFKYISINTGHSTYTATICHNAITGKYAGIMKETLKPVSQTIEHDKPKVYEMGVYEMENFYKAQTQARNDNIRKLYNI